MVTVFMRHLIVSSLLLMATHSACAYGPVGHSTIGKIAADLITGHRAEAEVQRILGRMSLAIAANWADCAKGIDIHDGFKYTITGKYPGCIPFEPQEEEHLRIYVEHNNQQCWTKPHYLACHVQYHFVDEAIQRERYIRGQIGTSDHDLVSALSAAMRVLKGEAAVPPISLNEREALLLLIHLVGDAHQPLHMADVYLDAQGKLYDPDLQGQDPNTATQGGNALEIIKPNGTRLGISLHTYWDNLPDDLTKQQLAALPDLARRVEPTTDINVDWPVRWASEELQQARETPFKNVTFGPRESGQHGSTWNTTLPDGYHERSLADVQQLLAKAGARLAQLLMSIWPDQVPASAKP